MIKLSKSQLAVLALIVANLIWGAASPIFKWSLENIEPFTLAFLRFFIATYLVLPFAFRNLNIQRQHLFPLIIGSIFGITINITFFFLGLQYAASINAPIIGSSGPIFLFLGSMFFLHEKLKTKVVVGTLVSLAGIIVIIIRPILEHGVDTSVIGNILFLLATIGSVMHTLIFKRISSLYSAMTLTFWSFYIGAVTFLPLMLWEVQTKGFIENLTMQGIIGILFGAILSSATAYALFTYALKYIKANETGIFLYIDPVVSVLIAVPLLGEQVTASYMLGSILVFLGIYIAEGRLHYHPFQRLSEGLKSII